ncbi:MAG: hypothetical protein D6703_02150 [Zetaproteobacteria bacterium]|nr:MAG: hypothetical protein D6703_02150 [Zetaproteobacteria bacterium]
MCDEMLRGLGKWLRIAGYDTAIAEPGSADRQILEMAAKEQRLLITRDRDLARQRLARGRVLLLSEQGMAAWAAELKRKLGIDWLYRPFSRCLLCNCPLCPGPGPLASLLPEHIVRDPDACWHCPTCMKPYWAGSHVRRMRNRLRRWAMNDSDAKV